MAEDLTPTEPEGLPELPPYQSRFQLIFGVLLGIAMAAIVATVVFATSADNRLKNDQSPPWSSWKPHTQDAAVAVREIAEHIGGRYTFPNGHQIVAVRGGDLTAAGLPTTVALDPAATTDGKATIFDQGQGIMYTLCGLGKNCAIKEGKPSIARHVVLRREGLELALYTFRYIKDVAKVVVMMPPPPGEKASQLLFFRRQDVNASLVRPLTATLPDRVPAINHLPKKQRTFLDQLTGRNLFAFRFEPGQDGTVFMVLSPPPTG